MSFYVYMLKCADESYYVGHTDDLSDRMEKHHRGTYSGYTKSRRPLELVFHEAFGTRDEAFQAEQQIKGWTRAKKEALIRKDWKLISKLAERRVPNR